MSSRNRIELRYRDDDPLWGWIVERTKQLGYLTIHGRPDYARTIDEAVRAHRAGLTSVAAPTQPAAEPQSAPPPGQAADLASMFFSEE